MSATAQPSVNLHDVPLTREQLEDELKRMGPRAYIGKDKDGIPMVCLKRRREVKEQEKMHPAQNWAPDSLSNTKRPKVWPSYKCTVCNCCLWWAVGPETQCGVCAGRNETDCECEKSDNDSSDDESVDLRPHHSEGRYSEYDTRNQFVDDDDTGTRETCGYCSAYPDSCSQVTAMTRYKVETIFCNFTCLMRMGVKARDALDEDQK